MQDPARDKLPELHRIISKMPLDICCMAALPEFGVKWREVAQAVRNARLPMQPSSVARVLCKYIAKALSAEEVQDIVSRLRLKLIATQERTWHMIRLQVLTTDESISTILDLLPARIAHYLSKGKNRSIRPEIQTVLLGDLMYFSVQLVSGGKEGAVLYVATPPCQDVALVSSLSMVRLLKASVEGLGYKKYENTNLYGRDIHSLLRISNQANVLADHLTNIPEYQPTPVITPSGIDYTNKKYDENYVDTILGPNPPVLTDLDIKTVRPFYDSTQLNKIISLNVSLKSEDISKSLKCWVKKGALMPTSDFFKIFSEIRSNRIEYNREDSD